MRLTSHKTKRESKLELSMTSMIDVVFLLLIFFMTTTTFIKPEREQSPITEVQNQAGGESDLEPTIIEVTEKSGRFVYLVGENEITEYDELVSLLKRFDNQFDGAFVRVGDEPPFEMAARAIQACKSAGYTGVTYVPNPN